MNIGSTYEMRVIGHIESPFKEKFGVPRQSGLAPDLPAEIVFLPEFSQEEAFRGLEGYSHVWLLWVFDEAFGRSRSLTVRPPRLGGNRRVGVFATRSPYRPNSIGLSCVRLDGIVKDPEKGVVLKVRGADLRDGTPILDVKPYLPFADAYPDASAGFAGEKYGEKLKVVFPEELSEKIPDGLRQGLEESLKEDPRPAYQDDPGRVYGLVFDRFEIRFRVENGVLTVVEVKNAENLQ